MQDAKSRQVHKTQRLAAPDGSGVDIDDEIVPLIHSLWALNLNTVASCQDFGDGVAGQRAADPHPSRYGGDAFIAYHTGFAWLKMPLPDARCLTNMLLSTRFRDKISLRWTPGSWRMHVPLIPDANGEISLAAAAQIYFPREQIPDLTTILESIFQKDICRQAPPCRPTRARPAPIPARLSPDGASATSPTLRNSW
jgi:hypothetical protein